MLLNPKLVFIMIYVILCLHVCRPMFMKRRRYLAKRASEEHAGTTIILSGRYETHNIIRLLVCHSNIWKPLDCIFISILGIGRA